MNHTQYAGVLSSDRAPSDDEIAVALTRGGRPAWFEADFHALLRDLQHRGCGWLRSDAVGAQLQKMTEEWQEPKPLTVDSFSPVEAILEIESRRKVGRNDLCPCGSGRQYKKCCGN